MSINVLITPELLDSILSASLQVYEERRQRAAMRGGLVDAAALCDVLASEFVAQNRKGNRVPSKAVQEVAAAFRRAGDEIMRMRERVSVPGALR